VWRHSEAGGWQQDGPALAGHGDWVRDVAWAPNLGLPASTLVSGGQDGRVFIWAERPGGGWERTLLQDFQVPQPYHNPMTLLPAGCGAPLKGARLERSRRVWHSQLEQVAAPRSVSAACCPWTSHAARVRTEQQLPGGDITCNSADAEPVGDAGAGMAGELVADGQRAVGVGRQRRGDAVEGGPRRRVAADHKLMLAVWCLLCGACCVEGECDVHALVLGALLGCTG